MLLQNCFNIEWWDTGYWGTTGKSFTKEDFLLSLPISLVDAELDIKLPELLQELKLLEWVC